MAAFTASQFVAASSLAQRYGVKSVVFGGPGSGKTPMIKTAPRPFLLVVEPGMLSMRDAHNIPAAFCDTPAKIDDFFKWLLNSKEVSNFDTFGIDSISQLAETILEPLLVKHKHGLKAYGELADVVMGYMNAIYYKPNLHTYLIAKQTVVEEAGVQKRKPYFPGQMLNVKVPHLFDEILHLGRVTIPGVVGEQLAFRTKESYDVMARDRSGNLAEFEPPNLKALFEKAMSK